MLLSKLRSRGKPGPKRLVSWPRLKVGRWRSRLKLAFVGAMACVVPGCVCLPVQVHHLTCGPEPKARGLKAGDEWTVSLCVGHHTALHAMGNERRWWALLGLDGETVAAEVHAQFLFGGAMP